MKITLMSDVHTEFWTTKNDYLNPGEGDVLCLCGDIGVAEDITNPQSFYRRFLRDCAAGYNRVFMVMGNHEHYNWDFMTTEQTVRDNLPEGVTLLQNQSELVDGVHFVGATLWADFNNGNPNEMMSAQGCMNDYHCVSHGERPLQPADTLSEHDESVSWLRQVLPTLRGEVVVMTHHAPSSQSVKGRYTHYVNGAYATNLSQLIETLAPTKWFHGHIHESSDYKIGTTQVLCNPYGYAGSVLNSDFVTEPLVTL